MPEQIEREIAHLDTEPLTLHCDRCGNRATWFGMWSCCKHDDARCAQHASDLNAVVKGAVVVGGSQHTPCKTLITGETRLFWVAVGKR